MRLLPAALLSSLLLSFSLPALAAYKCESNGTTTYSDTPCPAGKQIELANKTAVNEREAARSKEEAKREKTELTRLEKERHKREAAEQKQANAAARATAAKKAKCDTLAQRIKWDNEDAAHATRKAAERAKRRARRAAESYDMQCK